MLIVTLKTMFQKTQPACKSNRPIDNNAFNNHVSRAQKD